MAEREAGRAAERGEHDVLDEELPARRVRLAPTASRMPISRRRASARASMTLATLAHATTRRMATAPRRVLRLGAEVAGEILAQRARVRRHRVVLVARVPDRLVGAQEVLLAVLDRDARLQPADAARAVALIRLAGSPAIGTHTGRCRETESAAGMTPTIVCGTPLSLSVRPRTSGVRREAVAPHAFVDHDDALGLRAIFLGRERPAEERADAEHGGEVVGDDGTLDPFGAGAVGQVEAVAVVERDAARTVSRPGATARSRES